MYKKSGGSGVNLVYCVRIFRQNLVHLIFIKNEDERFLGTENRVGGFGELFNDGPPSQQ